MEYFLHLTTLAPLLIFYETTFSHPKIIADLTFCSKLIMCRPHFFLFMSNFILSMFTFFFAFSVNPIFYFVPYFLSVYLSLFYLSVYYFSLSLHVYPIFYTIHLFLCIFSFFSLILISDPFFFPRNQ